MIEIEIKYGGETRYLQIQGIEKMGIVTIYGGSFEVSGFKVSTQPQLK